MGIVSQGAECLSGQSRGPREAQASRVSRPTMCPETERSGPRVPPVRALIPPETRRSPFGHEAPVRVSTAAALENPKDHDESQMGTSTAAPRLAGGVNRGGRGSRTSGLVPQCGHCVRSIPVTSCIHCTTLGGWRGEGLAGWPVVPDSGAVSVLCAGWQGSRNAGDA